MPIFHAHVFGTVVAARTIAYTGTSAEAPGGTVSSPRTRSAVPSGTANSGRYSLAAIMVQRDGTGDNLTGVSINGVAATKLGTTALSGNANDHIASFWIAANPTGTTADVVLTFTGLIYRWAVALFEVANYTALHDQLDVGTLTTIDVSGAIDCQAGGVIAACVLDNGATTYTWTNITESVDTTAGFGNTYSAACDAFATVQTGLTITATQASNQAPQAMKVISF